MVSIVIPAYNEEHAIAQTIKDVRRNLVDGGEDAFEIIVVDDASKDLTAEVAKRAGANVIRKHQNIGYGHSLKLGIEAAKYDTIVIIDGDGTYPAERIADLLKKYREGYHMVVGERTGAYYRESWLKAPLRYMLRLLVEFTAGRTIPDVNSGLRVFSRADIMPIFPALSNAFSFTTSSTLAYMLQYRYVAYIQIDYHERIGKTKVRLFRDSLRVIQYIFSAILFYNPIKLFLALCFSLFCLAAPLILAGLFFDSSVAVLIGSATLLVAILIFALGLTIDAIRQYSMSIQRPTSEPKRPDKNY